MQYRTDDREPVLARFARDRAIHWKQTLLIALAITIIAGVGMALLRLDLTFYSIMPRESRATADLVRIVEGFPASSTIVTVISGGDDVRAAADAVAQSYRSADYADTLSHVESRFDDSFLLQNGLMLLPANQISRLRLLLAATAARTSGTGTAASNLVTLDLRDVLRTFGAGGYADFGDGTYYLNEAENRALVFAQPKFNINDVMVYSKVIPDMERDAKRAAAELGAEAGLTGLVVVGKDEMETSQQGLELSMAIAVVLILGLLIVVYRMWSVPLIAGVPLLLGILWCAGITGFVLGRLNIMTAMYMVALVGLGIDYGIHLLTSYRQFRDRGAERIDSIAQAVSVSGNGIVTGAVTTAVAFFALVVAESSLVRELGVVAGIGILSELAAMLLLVPAFLGLRADRIAKKESAGNAGSGGGVLDRIAPSPRANRSTGNEGDRQPRPLTALLIILVAASITTALGVQAPGIEVEGNLMEMEAKGLESVALQEVMVEEFGMAPDTLSVIADDIEEATRLTEQLETLASVAAVDSIAYYLPPETEQAERETEIEKLRTVLNTIVAAEGSPLAPLARALLPLTEDPRIAREDLPTHIDDLYFSKAAATGSEQNLITIIPEANPWVRENREAFTAEVSTITDRATGMVLAADQMTRIAEQDGKTAAIAAIIAITIILLIDLRNVVLTLLTLIPLACSFISLFGIMALTGIKFDFINIISVPLLIGIGIDDAVHISHRYVLEGRGRILKTVRLTGAAILLTSITTIIGFGSFIPSVMRAMRSTGIVLSIAMALAFLYSVVLHPALLYLVRERLGLSLEPYRFAARKHQNRPEAE